MFFIDIAVPRDIEPNINKLDNVYLYDIDDLQGVVDDNLEERNKEALKAEKIINEEVDKFIGMLRTVEVTPTILSLRKKLEEIGKDELKKTIARLTNINEKDKKILELLTVSIVNKIAHHPITFLKKKVADGNTGFSIDLVRELFHLDK